MTTASDIAVIVTSFERPGSLARCLLSLSLQTSSHLPSEIVVADDGSRDETASVVESFARQSRLSVTFTTHLHDEFQPGRSRNEGVLASTAPYLLFLDGDCLAPPHLLAVHAVRCRVGVALCGESYRLSAAESEALTEDAIRLGSFLPFVGRSQQRRLARKAFRDRLYGMLRVPMRPRLTSNHFSLWRADFERVDGFDLGYRGWGLEDRDLQRRLSRSGIRCRTVLPHAASFHLWHPVVESFVRNARGTPNEAYYRRPSRRDHRAYQGMSGMERTSFSICRWRNGELVARAPLAEMAPVH